jgi:hypothetical protein
MGLSQGWTVIGGPASDLYAGSAGVFAIDPASGDIETYDGTPGNWTVIGGPGEMFAEGGSHLYGLGPNGAYVAEWTKISDYPAQPQGTPDPVAVSRTGIYGVSYTDGVGVTSVDLYSGSGTAWTVIGGPAGLVAAGD